eukprot:922832-Prymnesium_polylepis.1
MRSLGAVALGAECERRCRECARCRCARCCHRRTSVGSRRRCSLEGAIVGHSGPSRAELCVCMRPRRQVRLVVVATRPVLVVPRVRPRWPRLPGRGRLAPDDRGCGRMKASI